MYLVILDSCCHVDPTMIYSQSVYIKNTHIFLLSINESLFFRLKFTLYHHLIQVDFTVAHGVNLDDVYVFGHL